MGAVNVPPKVLFIDPGKCAGCRRCSLACSQRHEGYFSLVHSRNEIVPLPRKGLFVNMFCRQCTHPPCEAVCPQRAISRQVETGALVVDADRCIGCRSCAIACPVGGVTKNMATGRMIKCDLCGGDPACVKECAYGALEYLPMHEGLSQQRRKALAQMTSPTPGLLPAVSTATPLVSRSRL